jgi:hypothetical protein
VQAGDNSGISTLVIVDPVSGAITPVGELPMNLHALTSSAPDAASSAARRPQHHVGGADASFWRRDYAAPAANTLPRWRSADRSLSPYSSGSVGLRLELDVSSLGLYAEGVAMYTRFHDHALLGDRTAIVVQTGLRWNR